MNKISFSYYWFVAGVTLLVNILNLIPGNDYWPFIKIMLWNDNSVLEILDIVFLTFTLAVLLKSMCKGKLSLLTFFCLFLLLFFIGEETSYGMHFNHDPLNFFSQVDGANEGNFHGANLIPGFGVELINFFYILSGPFFLWLFDERGVLRKVLKLKLPQRFFTTHQAIIYILGCWILPLDGLDKDIELNQFYHTSVYANLLIFIHRISKTGHGVPSEPNAQEKLMTFAQWSTLIPATRGIVY